MGEIKFERSSTGRPLFTFTDICKRGSTLLEVKEMLPSEQRGTYALGDKKEKKTKQVKIHKSDSKN